MTTRHACILSVDEEIVIMFIYEPQGTNVYWLECYIWEPGGHLLLPCYLQVSSTLLLYNIVA